MARIVVLGGSGFLGSYVLDELIRRNYSVVVADRRRPQHRADGFEFVECDIMNPDSLNPIIEGAAAVYNFAGQADVDDSVPKWRETVELNVLGNLNVLDACVEAKVNRFVFASSAYAISNKGSFYGISKQTSERIVREFSDRFGLAFTIIRYGSLYGGRADHRNGIHRVLYQAMTTGKIVHNGDGEEIREYIHAMDAARLSVDVMEQHAYVNGCVVLTGVERLKYKDILQMISEMTNGKVEIAYTNEDRDGHYKITPYSLQTEIGMKLIANPFIDLGQGLMDCIERIQSTIEKGSVSK